MRNQLSSKIKKNNNKKKNTGTPEFTCPHYPLNVEGITFTSSLLPSDTSKTWVITKNNFSININHENVYTNVVFKNLHKFIESKILPSIACIKSSSNSSLNSC